MRLALALLWPATAPASPAYLGLHLENDAVSGTDRYFTHGTRLDYQYPLNQAPDIFNRLRGVLPAGNRRDLAVGLYLAQYVFTASDIEAVDPPQMDRPYGGWLNVGLYAAALDGNTADTLSLNIGVVGPASGAEQVQRSGHVFIGSPAPRGWDTQLANEFALDLSIERRHKLRYANRPGFDGDLIPYAGANLGNVFALARAGAVARFGFNLPGDFGPDVAGPAMIKTGRGTASSPRWGWNVFAAAEGRYVYHNIFLDGSLFRESRSVDKKPWVFDWTFGVQATLLRDVVLTYAYVIRSEEFEAQPENHSFSVASIGLHF